MRNFYPHFFYEKVPTFEFQPLFFITTKKVKNIKMHTGRRIGHNWALRVFKKYVEKRKLRGSKLVILIFILKPQKSIQSQ